MAIGWINNTLNYPAGHVFTTNTVGNSTGPIKFYNNLVIANALLNTPSYPTFAATEKEPGIWLEPLGRRMGSSISSIQTRNNWG